tara:strand:+ start:314 stop:1762 length:1449 start_codon:yes stop_codon:yes gene_type:complete
MSVRANNLANVNKRYLQLHPVNATSGGVFSFKNGLPLIKFDISSSMAPLLLDGGALRLSGNLTAKQGAAGTTNLNATQLNFIDNFAGVNNMIEMITISSKRLNSTLERITNYYRLAPSIVSGQQSEKDIETRMGLAGNQHGTIPLTKSTLASYNAVSPLGGVAAGNQLGGSFSTPIYAGIFQSGQDIDLSAVTGTGGLVIEILLRSDVGTIFGTDAAANQASYQLSNLVLTAPVYEVGGESASAMAGGVNEFNFNSWSSMFQTINASSSVVAMTPGLSRVASCLVNFVTASDLGNQNFNACRLGPVAEVQQLRWSKNGALFPLQYRLQTVAEGNNSAAAITGTPNASYHIYNVNADILRNYLEGLTTDRYNKVRNCMSAYNTWAGGAVDRPQNAGRDGITPSTSDGVGILYDAYGSGTDFSQQVWSFELRTSATNVLRVASTGPVDVANNIDGQAATAQAATIYFLNKNTLFMSPNGINVQR